MPSKGVTVLLDEEYGYRTWLWRTEMSEEQLIAWWQAQPTMDDHFFDPSKTLPGRLTEVDSIEPEATLWRGHVHMDDDSFILSPSGVEYHHAGYEETDGE